jgi:excisionase family DNA binding protein
MTKKEIAVLFGITERTVEIWMRRRYVPYLKIGQSVRFRVSTVLQYVEEKYMVRAQDRSRPRSSALQVSPSRLTAFSGPAA